MPTYDVSWSVVETVNGAGKHDGGVKDGGHRTLAEGRVQKEAASEEAIRTELTTVLKGNFPEHVLGPTYDLERIYKIEITQAD